jgi:hypothetical protein
MNELCIGRHDAELAKDHGQDDHGQERPEQRLSHADKRLLAAREQVAPDDEME